MKDIWKPIPFEEISEILQSAFKTEHCLAGFNSGIFFDLTRFRARIAGLQRSFPATCLNALAVKANPMFNILKVAQDEGLGAEVASNAELYLAQKAGFLPSKIVFDSPTKTPQEIAEALKLGVLLNADSLAELKRIEQIIEQIRSPGPVGLRINPQVGDGTIAYTSTAGHYSKFGVPIGKQREAIINAYSRYPWLTGIHLHIGSQGCPVESLLSGISKVCDLAVEINRLLKRDQITVFDIGGGLPTAYTRDKDCISVEEYARQLKLNSPALFSSPFKLITEFGRHIQANLAFAVSRIEYVKEDRELFTACIHLGADMFLRECYNPGDWHHDILIVNKDGKIKVANPVLTNLAGPLCFSGDFVAKNILLPQVEQGDYAVICDVGAYNFGMWSRYNSRPMPWILGYDDQLNFTLLKREETVAEAISCWGAED